MRTAASSGISSSSPWCGAPGIRGCRRQQRSCIRSRRSLIAWASTPRTRNEPREVAREAPGGANQLRAQVAPVPGAECGARDSKISRSVVPNIPTTLEAAEYLQQRQRGSKGCAQVPTVRLVDEFQPPEERDGSKDDQSCWVAGHDGLPFTDSVLRTMQPPRGRRSCRAEVEARARRAR